MLRIKKRAHDYIPVYNQNRESENPLSVKLDRLSYGDFWEMAALINSLQEALNTKNTVENAKEITRITGEIKGLIIKYVKEINNFIIDDRPGTVAEIMDEPGLIGLVMELMIQLLAISRPEESVKKKSESTSENGTPTQELPHGSISSESATSGIQTGART